MSTPAGSLRPALRLPATARPRTGAAALRAPLASACVLYALAHVALVPTGGTGAVVEAGLVLLAPSLRRGSRRALLVAAALALALAAEAAVARGSDDLLAAAGILLAAGLVAARSAFPVPGDPASRPALAAALSVAAAAAGVDLLEADGLLTHPIAWTGAAAAAVLCLRALRPRCEPAVATPGEWRRAVRIVRAHGADTLAPFALRRDKRYFFAPGDDGLIAYRVVAGVALVSGEPIGEPAATGPLLDAFLQAARDRGLTVAALGVGVGGLPAWRARGFAAHYTGDEAVLRPDAFSLEGRTMRKVRQSVTRLERAGYRVEVRGAVGVEPALASELAAIAARWRGAARETGYSMAFDGTGVVPERDDVYAIAFDGGGTPRGFLHLGRTADALSLSSMRRDRDTPNGLNEFLVARLLQAAATAGVERVSLNFAAFAAVLAAPGPLDRVTALERRALRALAGRFQLDRLRAYNEKFLPDWLPRYAVYPSSSALPRVLLAAMLAEAYIALPRLRRRGRP